MDAIAAALGPWYTILGFLATLIALLVYFRKGLKKLGARTENAAAAAAHAVAQSTHASNQSEHASSQAAEANDNSRQATVAIEFLATELAKANDRGDYLANEVSTLFGALARERAKNSPREPRSIPDSLPETGDDIRDTETTITGKHRLHTSMIPTPTQDDDFL